MRRTVRRRACVRSCPRLPHGYILPHPRRSGRVGVRDNRTMSDTSLDEVLSGAVELARTALLEVAQSAEVGEHVAAVADGELLISQIFACTKPGYRGWHWSVTVTRAPQERSATVNDVVLLPGDDAIVAPGWTPYKERIQPGDLSPGDVLPPEDDDIRLAPAWFEGDGDDNTVDRAFAREVGLGREHVLSLEGRDIAADRWYDSEQGPDAALAQQAPGACRSCGFMVSLAGPLSRVFGVCANGMANDDGRVVSFDHGCGAHSEAKLSRSASPQEVPPPVFDTIVRDDVETF